MEKICSKIIDLYEYKRKRFMTAFDFEFKPENFKEYEELLKDFCRYLENLDW